MIASRSSKIDYLPPILWKQNKMKDLVNVWNWLFEAPPDQLLNNGKTINQIEIDQAAQLLNNMRSKATEIQTVLEQVRLTTQEIQHQYEMKCRCYQELVGLALASKRQGNIIEARLAMAKAIQIERILPQFTSKLETSQELLITINKIHAQQESDFSLLEIDLAMISAQQSVEVTMHGHQGLDKSRDVIALQERLRNIQAEIEERYLAVQINSQLSNSSSSYDELTKPLNTQDIDERIIKLGGDGDQN
jgi:phage shock protein A